MSRKIMNKLSYFKVEDISSLFTAAVIQHYPGLGKFRRTHSTISFYDKKNNESAKRPQSTIDGFSESLCLEESFSKFNIR